MPNFLAGILPKCDRRDALEPDVAASHLAKNQPSFSPATEHGARLGRWVVAKNPASFSPPAPVRRVLLRGMLYLINPRKNRYPPLLPQSSRAEPHSPNYFARLRLYRCDKVAAVLAGICCDNPRRRMYGRAVEMVRIPKLDLSRTLPLISMHSSVSLGDVNCFRLGEHRLALLLRRPLLHGGPLVNRSRKTPPRLAVPVRPAIEHHCTPIPRARS